MTQLKLSGNWCSWGIYKVYGLSPANSCLPLTYLRIQNSDIREFTTEDVSYYKIWSRAPRTNERPAWCARDDLQARDARASGQSCGAIRTGVTTRVQFA
jgi:hypothetical protein